MNRIATKSTVAALAMIVAVAASQSHAALNPTPNILEPGSWNVGDLNTTYQEWDSLVLAGATPDVGLTTNPAIATGPTVSSVDITPFVPGAAILTGTQNYYSFNQDHGFAADIYNHGGPAGSGTHVIVQIGHSVGLPNGILPGTVEIVDLAGSAIAGGANGDALQETNIFSGTVIGPVGPASYSEDIWEFFLPNYTGDFRVQGSLGVHASFDVLRVDSIIATQALPITEIPEPASLALLGLGGLAVLRRRKK